MTEMNDTVKKAYELAKEAYAALGIDTDKAIETAKNIPISLHCWQGDDVKGFENAEGELTGGIAATGNYPGRARTPAELRADLEKAMSLIPGALKVNIHALYADSDEKVERNKLEPKHFERWVEWAKKLGIGLDYNPSFFSHEMSASGFTLSSADDKVRDYWIEHGIGSRKIAEYFGKETGKRCVTNFWIPDGYKDTPADCLGPRMRLKDSLDKIFAFPIKKEYNVDAVESKVFGMGVESYTTGSNEFYTAYAATHKDVLLTLDVGHYHPTEVISDKISAMLCYCDELLLHVSRPVRWDSDHVVILNDELLAIMNEIVAANATDRVNIALDYFDASINRVAAWVIGTRNARKALLTALLRPVDTLKKYELDGDYTSRLAMMEELKSYPFAAVWDYMCELEGVPVREAWLKEVKDYESSVQLKRN